MYTHPLAADRRKVEGVSRFIVTVDAITSEHQCPWFAHRSASPYPRVKGHVPVVGLPTPLPVQRFAPGVFQPAQLRLDDRRTRPASHSKRTCLEHTPDRRAW